MSFALYDNLRVNIATWMARDDLAAYIPDFITLFECAAARRLKVRLQELETTITPTSGVATLPTDYLGMRRVTWTGSPRVDLTYVAPSSLQAEYPTQPSATPSVYTIEGSNLSVMPSSDTPLEIVYYQRTAALSGTLNWLYNNHPDVYLFGSLCEANAFNKGKAFESASLWKNRRDEAFDEIQRLDFTDRPTMQIRVMGSTP